MKTSIMAALAVTAVPFSVLAQTDREAEKHVHGQAELNVVLDNNTVYIDFLTPWANLVGFEHAPSTDEQALAVDNALALLDQPASLFSFNGSSCEGMTEDISSAMADGDDDAHHDDDEDHHDEEMAHHDDDEDHHDEEHEGHSSVSSIWAFTCSDTASLKSIDVRLFEQWPNLESLRVQLAGQSGQSSATLEPDAPSLSLSEVR